MKTKLLSLALFLLVSFSMQAQPPSFSGVYAGSISSSSVTISCNVNGNNSLTTGYFAISTSLSDLLNGNPSTLAFSSIPASLGTLQSRNKTFTGLLASTTYYYRAVASNTWGQTVSNYASFQTTASPITNVTVSDITNSSAKINYTANGQAIYSNVQYGFATNNYPLFVAGFPTNLQQTVTSYVSLTGLAAGTTYYVKVQAQANAFGSYDAPEISFTTTGTNIGPAFSTISTTAISGDAATVNFTVISPNLAHSSVVKYGTSASDLNMQTAVDNVTVGNNISAKVVPLTNLTQNTQYFYKIEATNANGTTSSAVQNFTTLLISPPTLTNISHSAGTNSAIVTYTMTPNNSASTSVINYGLSQTALTNEIIGLAAASNSITGTIDMTNLQPNTTYFYSVKATNSTGVTNSPVASFTTSNVVQISYNFDGNYTNTSGNSPFASNAGTSFVSDRNGNANSALNINNSGTIASISGLPYGNSPRSFSVWVKLNTMNATANYPFHYGTSTNGNGLLLKSNQVYYFANGTQNIAPTTSHTVATWYHYVCTFDGTTAKIYKNGTLLSSGPVTWNTTNTVSPNANSFKLGMSEDSFLNYFNGALDDLKIFDYVITNADITSLYTNNTLASEDFNAATLKVTLYPNPTKERFTIATDAEIATVEIYSTQGQKVLTATQKNIDISNLASGIYFVKIETAEKTQTIQKIVKQ